MVKFLMTIVLSTALISCGPQKRSYALELDLNVDVLQTNGDFYVNKGAKKICREVYEHGYCFAAPQYEKVNGTPARIELRLKHHGFYGVIGHKSLINVSGDEGEEYYGVGYTTTFKF